MSADALRKLCLRLQRDYAPLCSKQSKLASFIWARLSSSEQSVIMFLTQLCRYAVPGSETTKVDPSPSTLDTTTSPDMPRASVLLMARPRPTPSL